MGRALICSEPKTFTAFEAKEEICLGESPLIALAGLLFSWLAFNTEVTASSTTEIYFLLKPHIAFGDIAAICFGRNPEMSCAEILEISLALSLEITFGIKSWL